jgi:hypothetical protein
MPTALLGAAGRDLDLAPIQAAGQIYTLRHQRKHSQAGTMACRGLIFR